jgi:hypothetical protein
MTFLGNEVAGRDSKTMPRRWTRIAQRERLLFTRPQSSIMVFLIVRIEGIEGTAKPLIGLLTLLGLPRLVCLPGLLGFLALLCLLVLLCLLCVQ